MVSDAWPPTARERAAARMRDAAFLVVLRAWLLRRRTDRFVADATREAAPEGEGYRPVDDAGPRLRR